MITSIYLYRVYHYHFLVIHWTPPYRIDCVGILKLRNADVEQRIGIQRSKKKSTKARLVFRTFVPKGDGSSDGLQVASTPILCSKYPASDLIPIYIMGINYSNITKHEQI